MYKPSVEYQSKWSKKPIYDPGILDNVGQNAQLHKDIDNVMSSAASCMNVLANLGERASDLAEYLNRFDLGVQEVIPFPSNSNVGGEIYDDKGNVIFEWMGPRMSTIEEGGSGKRGLYRTSIDGFVLARINNHVTQVLIEWKFTESYATKTELQKFAGKKGIERLRRYSAVLKPFRNKEAFPFNMADEGSWGLYDLGYEPLYQLLRMTLLAKTTAAISIGDQVQVEDYRVLHLSHSENSNLNIVSAEQLRYSPGLSNLAGSSLHEVWGSCLSEYELERFRHGCWNNHFDVCSDLSLQSYLEERYG